jgi:hypothetical protein
MPEHRVNIKFCVKRAFSAARRSWLSRVVDPRTPATAFGNIARVVNSNLNNYSAFFLWWVFGFGKALGCSALKVGNYAFVGIATTSIWSYTV